MIAKNILPAYGVLLRNGEYTKNWATLNNYLSDAIIKGWTLVVVDQRRGFCHYAKRVITIPVWVIAGDSREQNKGKLQWYIAHELAHSYAGPEANHGPLFMAWLKKICPEKFQHWEMDYKPRNAVQAGIGCWDF